MLFSQDFRRRHESRLVPVFHRDQHRHKGNDGLAASHVSLKKTVHRFRCRHIVKDLANDAHLGAGQRKWETIHKLPRQPALYCKCNARHVMAQHLPAQGELHLKLKQLIVFQSAQRLL